MFKPKIDGVIEGVKYTPEGDIDYVRGYERRDMAYSDVVILERDQLIQRLKDGKRFFTGHRQQYLGSSFETKLRIELQDRGGKTIIRTGDSEPDHDQPQDFLEGVPIF